DGVGATRLAAFEAAESAQLCCKARFLHRKELLSILCTAWPQRSRVAETTGSQHELLGQKDVKTTMVYAHVLNREPKGASKPHRPHPEPVICGPV
ncbi:hypothetical protein MYX75_06785, partial [Acidobacteria bacterium AH-259-A15]|nr:hypothetical protein [Acidobacteria bacterium AH-259-A15]